MDTRSRILAALCGGEPDQVPLTVYAVLLPQSKKERLLRESGVGLIIRPSAHIIEHRNVEYINREYWENGNRLIRQTIHTPVGDIYQTFKPESVYDKIRTSDWILEHFIKEPEDYRVMEFVLRDAIYHDNYEFIREAQRRIDSDGLVYVRLARGPIQEMLYKMMGMERFAIDYYDRRDLFDSLFNTMFDSYETLFDLAANAPVEIVLLVDNITSDVVGDERFRQYCMPVYKRLHEKLIATGKKLAVHMDGNLKSLKTPIAEAEFDIIEAITPPPVGDISVKEAREVWRDKALWLNFTSTMHMETADAIEKHTRQLLEEAGDKHAFAIGVTEDVPVEALEHSLGVISRVIQEY